MAESPAALAAGCERGAGSRDSAESLDRLVRSLAGRVLASLPRGCGIEMSDLIQAGNLGLLQATRNFSPGNGAPLAGYAKFRIRGEMLDTIRRHRSGREGQLGPGPFVHKEARDAENPIEEKIPARAEDSPLGVFATRERAVILGQELEKLPPRYRKVVELRYSGECSLREIGEALQVQESRACQIHRSALCRLRRALWNRGVREISQLM